MSKNSIGEFTMAELIYKRIVTESNDSPYAGSPHMGDALYELDRFDTRVNDVQEWVVNNVSGHWVCFPTVDNRIAYWFSVVDDAKKFEQKWM